MLEEEIYLRSTQGIVTTYLTSDQDGDRHNALL